MTGTQFQLRNPAISIYSHDLEHLAAFYKRLGFRETWRTANEAPVLVVLELDEFKLGITSVEAAIADHGLDPPAP